MNTQTESSPNDYKVVTFVNKTDFAFTPEMGCMYDGRPIFGISGASGIQPGESIILPYHVGNLLAQNLAKAAINRQAPSVDPAGIPTGVPLWNSEQLATRKASFLQEMYSEEKPLAMSETDRLMAKVEEYKAMVDKLIPKVEQPPSDNDHVAPGATQFPAPNGTTYQDKADVIAELNKRAIKFDARKSKAELEKLLA